MGTRTPRGRTAVFVALFFKRKFGFKRLLVLVYFFAVAGSNALGGVVWLHCRYPGGSTFPDSSRLFLQKPAVTRKTKRRSVSSSTKQSPTATLQSFHRSLAYLSLKQRLLSKVYPKRFPASRSSTLPDIPELTFSYLLPNL
ncbi:hypothetical protein L596_027794 [Steinernema carpocapsae]|uniref:Uncharacterized protein n=1 Tax=Steinernema carpocapsae TaxID=34508 RepID=A0A4V6XVM6_STECR|nr:hypothetical protein L596_027794 [Steinernema carpocapsae]